jgi:hypothetical protein
MIGDSSIEMSAGDGSVCNINAIRVESAEVGDNVYDTLVDRAEGGPWDNTGLVD